MTGLKVGTVAKRAGVHLQTILYYERRGLLPEPPRTGSNQRAYPEDTVRRVRFIKRAQELGFTLKEIEELLSLRAAPGTRCDRVREHAEIKVRDIEDRIRTLRAMREALAKLIGECSGRASVTACPILDAMDPEDRR